MSNETQSCPYQKHGVSPDLELGCCQPTALQLRYLGHKYNISNTHGISILESSP
jgi:hypothetical protein